MGTGLVWWKNLVSIGRSAGTFVGSYIDDNSICELGDGNFFLFFA